MYRSHSLCVSGSYCWCKRYLDGWCARWETTQGWRRILDRGHRFSTQIRRPPRRLYLPGKGANNFRSELIFQKALFSIIKFPVNTHPAEPRCTRKHLQRFVTSWSQRPSRSVGGGDGQRPIPPKMEPGDQSHYVRKICLRRHWDAGGSPCVDPRKDQLVCWGPLPSSCPPSPSSLLILSQQGFEPKECLYLKELLFKAIKEYCLKLENRLNIGIGRSTSALIIADPLAILEEGEIHLGFSTTFRDPRSHWEEVMLHDIDVLVARLPAVLPSDIQKVCSPSLIFLQSPVRQRSRTISNFPLTSHRFALFSSLSYGYIET